MRRALALLAATVLMTFAAACSKEHADAGPVVLAAASLQEALDQAADKWAERGHPRPVLSFAGTPALARQIEAGAPGDIFIAADEQWMDEVAGKGLVQPRSRATFAANSLVLIAPDSSDVELDPVPGMQLVAALGKGRLAMADPDAVPAGRYARQALSSLNVWRDAAGRTTRSENVRAALALVARGEAPLGIVYRSDAHASPDVRIVAAFPQASHIPITYPFAILQTSQHPDAPKLRDFLLSNDVQDILSAHGFNQPGPT